jgi:hypothetical protein
VLVNSRKDQLLPNANTVLQEKEHTNDMKAQETSFRRKKTKRNKVKYIILNPHNMNKEAKSKYKQNYYISVSVI